MQKDIQSIFNRIIQGDRVALGQSITLIESENPQDRIASVSLLELCNSRLTQMKSVHLTISGAPGVGKSTLIESIGLKAISEGFKVGVLTVDPTSTFSHGSILGDKSRMPNLSSSPSAFIRSSPAGGLLGGIGRRSRELMTLLSAVGYDVVFLETVGVGQSEHVAWQLTDGFILVIQPGSGDELQGIKRGITELADIIVVNKADGFQKEASSIAQNQFQNAIHYFSSLRTGWEPQVVTTSAIDGHGIDEFWQIIRSYWESRLESGRLDIERKQRNKFWLKWALGISAQELLMNHPSVNQKLAEGLRKIEASESSMFTTELEIENEMKSLISLSETPNNQAP